ncbi:bifunctional lysylphosphatidylglycerol synthetase/lysine--tRNA ligase LysX [Cellulomonas composti]|nr:bifunctional lysylphosphatidylglycerol synthetase/lysine--tRNA ligase LysX [Cellulomonas composti]
MQERVSAPVEPGRAPDEPAPPVGARLTPFTRRTAAVATVVVTAMAVWQLVGLLLLLVAPGFVHDVATVLEVLNVPSEPEFFGLVLVAAVAAGLRRGLRFALWFVVLVWQLPVALATLAAGVVWLVGDDAARTELGLAPLDVAAGVVAIVAVVLLVAARGAFRARLQRGAWWRAGLVIAGGIVVATAVGLVLLRLVDDTLQTAADRVRWSLAHAIGMPWLVAADGTAPWWVGFVVAVISGVALLLGLLLFLRSRERVSEESVDDRLLVRRLLLEFPSDDSLGYFATRDDRSARFSANRRAAVSYREIAGVSLAAGDPVGDPAAWGDAIERWLAEAREYGWVPAATSTTEAGARAYQAAGLHPMSMGDEAVIVTRSFDLANPALHGVRRSVDRVTAAGYTVQVRRQETIEPDELATLVGFAEAWRHGEERGYSMALDRLGAPQDPREVVVTAHDAGGEVRGLLSFVPWERRGLSLDVMRRSPDAVPGVTEFMVASLAGRSGDLGVERISLNFAMFRQVFELGERIGATPMQRFNRRVLLFASRFWQLESLYRSNEKYLPHWQPRLLCFESAAQLTRITAALGEAEGFLNRPRWWPQQAPVTPLAPDEAAVLAVAVAAQEQEVLAVTAPPRVLTQQQRARHAKLDVLRAAGMDPYPVSVPRTHTIAVALDVPATPDASGPVVSVVGRVVRLRDLGGVVFAVLREGGAQVQALLSADTTADIALWRAAVDLADHVGVTGALTHSRSGELSIAVTSWCMAAKALTPPPDKHRGLVDAEARARLRHMDLALADRPEQLLRARAAAVWSLRTSLVGRGFIEVETPILQRIHGGANARPFTTHINAYDLDLYLRIAPELFLKRLMVGGVGKVFELGRNFRNEGADSTHNPEFTSLEAYEAFGDYTTMREMTRELIVAAAIAVHGEPVAHRPGGQVVRLDGAWPTIPVHEAVSRALDREISPDVPLADLREVCRVNGIAFEATETHGALVTELYDRFVEAETTAPTFYTDFPVETSPLTRAHRVDPRLAERWDLVAFGAELGTAYSELVDPVEQRRRLTEQSILAAAGDPEAMEVDEEFLDALEFAMPPSGGVGIGVDRVVMMLVGGSIRDTLAFPFLRPSGRSRGPG